MEFKGTKAPWFIVYNMIYRRPKKDLYEFNGNNGAGVAGDKPICTIHKGWEEGGYPVEANAQLIAAAPELLEACNELIELLAFHGYTHATEINKAKEAINRALGK